MDLEQNEAARADYFGLAAESQSPGVPSPGVLESRSLGVLEFWSPQVLESQSARVLEFPILDSQNPAVPLGWLGMDSNGFDWIGMDSDGFEWIWMDLE